MSNLLTQPEVEQLAIKAGFSQTKYAVLNNVAPYRVAAAIAMVEGQTATSRTKTAQTGVAYTDADAVGDQALANSVWGYSYGFMQVRSLRSNKGTGKFRDEDQLPDPLFNLKVALVIWNDQRAQKNPPLLFGHYNFAGFEPWSTWRSGAYQAYLPDVYTVPPTEYAVVGGDSLSGIAAKLRMGSWTDWQTVNQLPDPNMLHINQRLDRPWWSATVQAGDTFASLAALNHLKAATLRTFNKTPRGEPAVGSTLLIPHRLLTRTTP